jgi:hypothetical protein
MDLTQRFSARVATASAAEIATDPTLNGALILDQAAPITVAYAPFDHVNTSARVVLVGITPGRQQAIAALLELRRKLLAGASVEDASRAAKETASFSGTMRPNLVAMLDYIGLQRWLGIATCADLFTMRADLVHLTSALRFPVYVNGENYGGTPRMTTHPILSKHLRENFADEVRRLPEAVFVPLGRPPADALRLLVREGAVDSARVLDGLPHPSGLNGERIAYFLGRTPSANLSAKTNPALIHAARVSLAERVSALVERRTRPTDRIDASPAGERPVANSVPSVGANVEPADGCERREAFRLAGYACLKKRSKCALFVGGRSRREVYLMPNKGEIKIVVHPQMTDVVKDIAATIGALTDPIPLHNANFLTFPKRIHTGQDDVHFGSALVCGTADALARFLEAFDRC